MHEVPLAKGKEGTRPTTLRDARKLDLLPSVTTILGVMHKPGLENWKIEQALLAVLSAPDVAGEDIDAKVKRVLPEMDEVRSAAAQLGTKIHAGIARRIEERLAPIEEDIAAQVYGACDAMWAIADAQGLSVAGVETPIVGDGYAGTMDLHLYGRGGDHLVIDFKTTRTKPGKKVTGYIEHRMQLGAYAAATMQGRKGTCGTVNIYVSTTEPGRVEVAVHDDWASDYEGFRKALELWQYLKGYKPGADHAF